MPRNAPEGSTAAAASLGAPAAVSFPLRVAAVLFDLDGTLVHTAPDLADAVNRSLDTLGLPRRGDAEIAGWIGNGTPRLVKRALTGTMDGEPEPPLFARAHELFARHYAERVAERSRVYPGVAEGLALLGAAGVPLAVVTNKPHAFTVALLETLALAPFFGAVVSGDRVARQKPDPLPLLDACRLLGAPPARALTVGDSASDVRAARAAGMPVVCVSYGYNHGADVRALEPDAVVDSIVEVAGMVTRG